MRIGITTVFAVPNYGAMLQAYALGAFLRSQGHEAETIDYRQPELDEMYRFRFRFPPAINNWLRLRRCADFVNKKIPLSRKRYRSAEEFAADADSYDAVITGSDQVWFTGPVQYYDPMFFLDFPAKKTRKISYAASVGGTEDFGEFAPKIREALSSYTSVGVRDAHTASLIEPLSPHPLTETVDPTFLHDFAGLVKDEPPIKEPYLLVFGDFNKASSEVVRAASEQTGIRKIVTLQYPYNGECTRIAAPGPVEWLNWFKHASFIVTSYFHGTAFALNFERPFLTVPTPGRVRKVKTLLEPLSLGDRCLNGPDWSGVKGLVSTPINWEVARAALGSRVQSSVAFLKSALS